MAHPTSVYKHITYVANPVDKNYESLEISVPVKVDGVAVDSANAPILFALSVGGYRSVNNAGRGRPGGRGGRGTGGPPKGAIGGPAGGRGMGGPPGGRSNVSRNTDLALAAGYVVVSPGCRGRDNRLVAARAQLTCRRVVGNSLLNGPPSQELQLPGIPSNGAFSNELPTFSITGFQQLGPPANTDSQFRTDVTEVVDQIS